MELSEAEKMAKELIQIHCPEFTFKFNNAKSKFGICNPKKKIIMLSKTLVSLNHLERVKQTILHEIAHALTAKPQIRGSNKWHDSIWRNKAIEIGCTGERTFCEHNTIMSKGNHTLKCPSCSNKVAIFRISKNINKKCCGVCWKATKQMIKMELVK